MTFPTFCAGLILAWAAIHILHHLVNRGTRSLLPASSTPWNNRRRVWKGPTTSVTLKFLHLRLETTAWNAVHDILAISLHQNRPWRLLCRMLTWFYDLGTILCVFGMVFSFGLLLQTTGVSAISLRHKLWPTPIGDPGLGRFYVDRRSIVNGTALNALPSTIQQNAWVQPVIPGITVPMSHLPLIFLAIFLAQVVHELGHALTAALESISILSTGVSITIIFPAAFVALPAQAVETLPPRNRARIVGAGPFHNFLLWGLLSLSAYVGLGNILCSVAYKDVSDSGRVVIDVDLGSPLYRYLPSGSLITHLDDYSLNSTGKSNSQDPWTSYLTAPDPDISTLQLGWCTGPLESSDLCCPFSASTNLSCFTTLTSPFTRGCLDPIPILTTLDIRQRCKIPADCSNPAGSSCVRPYRPDRLLRLLVRRHETTEVVLWSGPKEEVWNEVRVGTLQPRMSLLPMWLPMQIGIFVEYLIMGTLSLFLFNLLPLPSLDGAQFLDAVLKWSEGDVRPWRAEIEHDLEARGASEERDSMENSRTSESWTRTVGWLLPQLTTVLLVSCISLEVINAFA